MLLTNSYIFRSDNECNKELDELASDNTLPQPVECGREMVHSSYSNEVTDNKEMSDLSKYASSGRCGIGCFKPRALQCCAHVLAYSVIAGISILASQGLNHYMTSQITTIEKQFGLSSSQSGIILAANDIGFLTTVLLIGHYGRK